MFHFWNKSNLLGRGNEISLSIFRWLSSHGQFPLPTWNSQLPVLPTTNASMAWSLIVHIVTIVIIANANVGHSGHRRRCSLALLHPLHIPVMARKRDKPMFNTWREDSPKNVVIGRTTREGGQEDFTTTGSSSSGTRSFLCCWANAAKYLSIVCIQRMVLLWDIHMPILLLKGRS